MRNVLAWLSRFWNQASEPRTEPAKPKLIHYSIHYWALDGAELSSAEGATRRTEVETIDAGLIETRLYDLLPEKLVKKMREGTDQAGLPYASRTSYWPWGQEAVRVETSYTGGQRCVEYQSFFENGDLKMHKRLEGKRMTKTFAYASPRYSYSYVEQMPVYPGGNEQLLRDIQKVTKYPAIALRNRETGKVHVHFVVGSDGLLKNISVQQGVSPALDKAALQAIHEISSIRWRPGFQNRRAVNVSFTVPITFSI